MDQSIDISITLYNVTPPQQQQQWIVKNLVFGLLWKLRNKPTPNVESLMVNNPRSSYKFTQVAWNQYHLKSYYYMFRRMGYGENKNHGYNFAISTGIMYDICGSNALKFGDTISTRILRLDENMLAVGILINGEHYFLDALNNFTTENEGEPCFEQFDTRLYDNIYIMADIKDKLTFAQAVIKIAVVDVTPVDREIQQWHKQYDRPVGRWWDK